MLHCTYVPTFKLQYNRYGVQAQAKMYCIIQRQSRTKRGISWEYDVENNRRVVSTAAKGIIGFPDKEHFFLSSDLLSFLR